MDVRIGIVNVVKGWEISMSMRKRNIRSEYSISHCPCCGSFYGTIDQIKDHIKVWHRDKMR
jgi:hypothetical protein